MVQSLSGYGSSKLSSNVSFLGLNSNFDSAGLVEQLVNVETQAKVRPLQTKKNNLLSQKTFLASVSSQVSTARTNLNYKNIKTGATSVSPLKITTTGTDKDHATITTTDDAVAQNFDLSISKLATTSKRESVSSIKVDLTNASNISSANFKAGATLANGTVTINGVTQTFSNSSGTLANIEGFLNSFAGVTGTFNTTTGKFDLTGVTSLGSSGDSSNLISALGLDNAPISGGNVTGIQNLEAVTGATKLNAIGVTGTKITINGADIAINTAAAGDSVADLITKINNSSTAKVAASFDAINGKITLNNKETGALAITTSGDGNINPLNLTAQTLGDNAEFTISSINGGATLVSNSNTVDDLIDGVTINLAEVTTSPIKVTIAEDSSGYKTKINNFITDINKVLKTLKDKNDSFSRGLMSNIKTKLGGVAGVNGVDTYTSFIALGLKSTLDSEGKFTGYSLDSSKFDAAFAAAPDMVNKILWGNTSDPTSIFSSLSNGDKGILVQVNELLEDYVDPDVATNGVINQVSSSVDNSIKATDTAITRAQNSVKALEARMKKQFAQLDVINAKYQQQKSAVASLSR
jgi:flagellar hook-associated protein 2